MVLLGVLEQCVVELVSPQHVLTRITAANIRLALASDALFRFAVEALRRFLHGARGAGMALYAAQGPVS